MRMTLVDLAQRLGAVLDGDPEATVGRCRGIEVAESGDLAFLANVRYRDHLETSEATAVLVAPGIETPKGLNTLICDDPYFAFRNAVIELHGMRQHPEPMDADERGISSRAAVHTEAKVGEGTRIHPFATVEHGATIGQGCHQKP